METKNGKLCFSGHSADELCSQFGSPLYVYEASVIRKRFEKLDKSFSWRPFGIHYAVKANSNPYILRMLQQMGCKADTVSSNEVKLCLDNGFAPDDILFTGDQVSDAEMLEVLEYRVPVNAGSVMQIERLGTLAKGGEFSFRVNPDIGAGHHSHCITGGPKSKFGVYVDQVKDALRIAEKGGMKLVGLHAHLGSGILDPGVFLEAMDIVLNIAKGIPGLKWIDFGGGIGIPYRETQSPLDLEDFGRKLSDRFAAFCEKYGEKLEMRIEPGRFLVAEAGALLTTVTNLKSTPKHDFVGCDSGFHHLIRPMAYGSYHRIINASNPDALLKSSVVAGNICESGDVFTQGEDGIEDRQIANPKAGDVLAILCAGAYGYSMAMNYNMRSRPAEILLHEDDSIQLIRRREDYKDLLNLVP